jgi:hypothetical protein
MKFRPTLLLCGAVLIAALPVCADTIPYPGSVKASPGVEIFARDAHHSVVRMNSPVIGTVRAEPTEALLPINNLGENRAFDFLDSKSLVARGTILPSSRDLAGHSGSLNDLDSFEHGPSFTRAENLWDKEGDGKKDKDKDNDDDAIGIGPKRRPQSLTSTSVPEPGSLSLLLLGLAAIGVSARRRRNFSLTT